MCGGSMCPWVASWEWETGGIATNGNSSAGDGDAKHEDEGWAKEDIWVIHFTSDS